MIQHLGSVNDSDSREDVAAASILYRVSRCINETKDDVGDIPSQSKSLSAVFGECVAIAKLALRETVC